MHSDLLCKKRMITGLIAPILCKGFGRVFLVSALALLMNLLNPLSGWCNERTLQANGYFDIEAEVGDRDDAAKRWTFDQHHLTIIMRSDLSPRMRIFFETSYEHGPTISSSNGEGKIYLPRAFAEFFHSDGLNLRVGKFLPPFGIYNERHDATPTIIPTVLPRSVYGKHANLTGALADSLGQKVRAYPRFSTGLWLHGRQFVNDWEIKYHTYLVNGRGSSSHEKDRNANKGIGARLAVTPSFGPLTIGISAYSDRNDAINDVRQTALAVDAQYVCNELFIEGALLLPRNETLDSTARPSGSFRECRGFYLMAGFTIFRTTTPFAYYDHYDPDTDISDNGEQDITIGINQPINDTVVLKSEVHFYRFDDPAREDYRSFITSLAVAF